MPSIFIFLAKTTIAAGIFLGYYLPILRNRRMARFNRFFLLGVVIVSLLLPFLQVDFSLSAQNAGTSFPILPLTESVHYEKAFFDSGHMSLSWGWLPVAVYLIIAAFFVLNLIISTVGVYRLKRTCEYSQMDGYKLIITNHSAAPFSFLDLLFWRKDIDINSEVGRMMLKHELVHIQQHHTLDKLMIQLVCALCWVNPFFWIIRKELWLQHEFLADEQAVAEGNVDAFAQMLLCANGGGAFASATSLFFYSPIKRRLMMLAKKHRTTYPKLRRLLIAPLVVLVALVFSLKLNGKDSRNSSRSEKTITVVLDAAHGGKDIGARSAEGVEEKELTLRVTNELTALASEYNIAVISTRVDDLYPTLQERVDKGNTTKADIFLSVHVNQSVEDSPDANEYELGVCKRTDKYEQSMILASAVAFRMKTSGVNTVVADKSQVYVLNQSIHPSLLIECGNIDDQENVQFLHDNEKLESLCRAILSGIVDYSKRK